jgi:hypothetical protein
MKTRHAALLVLLVACVPKPEKSYSTDEVAKIDSLDELMRVQAEKADPAFDKREQASFTDAEFTQMEEVGGMLQATGERIGDRFGNQYKEGFVKLASQLSAQAKSLEDAAQGKDAAGVKKALGELRDTCSECHAEYR